ncbi:hypothetical protein ACNI3T_00655 [Christiangramia sp. ASW11-125]|uniref:hypothetical protein n=1 Tax=Christiangramia sp. ASW11-125 TaxID=3400701 RepID=UPI003AAB8F91
MKDEILQNLKKLFQESYSYAREGSIEKIIDEYIHETNQHYVSIGINNYLEDEEPFELKRIKKNSELEKCFKEALKFDFDENKIISNLVSDIQTAFSEIKSKLIDEKKEIENQAIFLEFDFIPKASIAGYGTGEYPILKEPKYLDFYPDNEIYIAIEKIDYRKIWKNLTSLENTIEKFEVDDYVFDSGTYQALRNSIIYKTYILLHKALNNLGPEIFNGLNIKKPLMIYGNEHDCEPISIYVLE